MMYYRPLEFSRLPHATAALARRETWSRLLISNRYILLLLVGLAIGLPELFHHELEKFGWGRLFEPDSLAIETSLIGSTVALMAAHLSLRHLGHLPLVSARLLVPPAFIGAYSVVIVLFYALQLPIAPYHFWTSFAIGMAVTAALSVLRARHIRPVVALLGLPEHFHSDLPSNIRWVRISSPELAHKVSAVVVDPHAEFDMETSQFLTRMVLAGTPVYHRAHIEEGLTGRVRFRNYADNSFGALLPSLTYLRLKRGLDLAILVVVAPMVLLLIGLAAMAIRIESPGPVFYLQQRRGYRGRAFICYKLRSMRPAQDGPAYTLSNDSRVTRVGRFIRKWRIDELPQALNILKGDMSWIGPRPEAVELATMYAAQVSFYDYRHAVRPGISGWAAVHQGNVALVDAARIKLEYDFYYIKYFSFWLDCLIMLKTVQTVLTGFGSR